MTSATADSAPTRAKRTTRRTSRGDRILHAVITGMVWIVLAIFAGVFGVLVTGAWPAMKRFGPGFIVGSGWDPVHLVFGAFPFLVGTVIVAAGAMVLAGGVGLMTAICVTELPQWLQEPLAYLIELLAFIPSVVYGLFGLLVLAPLLQSTVEIWLMEHLGPRFSFFNGAPYGVGYLTAIVILAIMLLPLIVSLSREALILVPTALKEGAMPWAQDAGTWCWTLAYRSRATGLSARSF